MTSTICRALPLGLAAALALPLIAAGPSVKEGMKLVVEPTANVVPQFEPSRISP